MTRFRSRSAWRFWIINTFGSGQFALVIAAAFAVTFATALGVF